MVLIWIFLSMNVILNLWSTAKCMELQIQIIASNLSNSKFKLIELKDKLNGRTLLNFWIWLIIKLRTAYLNVNSSNYKSSNYSKSQPLFQTLQQNPTPPKSECELIKLQIKNYALNPSHCLKNSNRIPPLQNLLPAPPLIQNHSLIINPRPQPLQFRSPSIPTQQRKKISKREEGKEEVVHVEI